MDDDTLARMRPVTRDRSHLWNDLPDAERGRLHPFLVESQILHLEQTRAMIVRGHARTLAGLDDQIANLKRELAP